MDVLRIIATLGAITLAALPLAMSLWALLDAARRPSWAWALCHRSQAGWMAAILCGILTVLGGLVISSFYLLRVRPRVAAAEDGDLGWR